MGCGRHGTSTVEWQTTRWWTRWTVAGSGGWHSPEVPAHCDADIGRPLKRNDRMAGAEAKRSEVNSEPSKPFSLDESHSPEDTPKSLDWPAEAVKDSSTQQQHSRALFQASAGLQRGGRREVRGANHGQ